MKTQPLLMKDVHAVVNELRTMLIKRSHSAHGEVAIDDDGLDAKSDDDDDDDDNDNDNDSFIYRDPGMMPGQIRVARNLECLGRKGERGCMHVRRVVQRDTHMHASMQLLTLAALLVQTVTTRSDLSATCAASGSHGSIGPTWTSTLKLQMLSAWKP